MTVDRHPALRSLIDPDCTKHTISTNQPSYPELIFDQGRLMAVFYCDNCQHEGYVTIKDMSTNQITWVADPTPFESSKETK